MEAKVWTVNLKVRLFGEAFFNLVYWMIFPFLVVYFSTAFGNHIAGLLMMIPPIVGMIGGLISGHYTDLIGRRPLMLLGVCIQASMFAVFAATSSSWIEFAAYVLVGLGGAIYRTPSMAMVADLVPKEERRQVIATFTTANNIGAVLGPALGAFFFFQYRDQLLWTATFILLLYAITIFLMIRETKPQVEKAADTPKQQTPMNYRFIFQDKLFFFFILAGVFSIMTIMQLDLYLAIYIVNYVPEQTLFSWNEWSLTLTSEQIFGWVLGLNGLLFVLLILPVTKWLKGWSERNVFILSALLAGIGMFAVGLHSSLWYLFIVTVIFTLGELIRAPVTESFVANYAPEHARGQYLGASNLQFTVGRFLAPITVFLSAWVQPIVVFSLLLGFSIISSLLYLYVFRLYLSRQPYV
ncbi:MDR family MFS transporter [Bacillus horti]|uniref:MFS family permease n=2 Tax=Caldalkalibacillus horti TaxID=77523 RepID=A0ABT9VZT1_9BACI|nr:MFS transporter [Bacillus horti]MDQ0166508.1 MFS family permease [Bacillus horti]